MLENYESMVPHHLKTSISFDRPIKKERGVPASEASLLVDVTRPLLRGDTAIKKPSPSGVVVSYEAFEGMF